MAESFNNPWGVDEDLWGPEEDVLQMDVLDVRSKPKPSTKPVTSAKPRAARGMDQSTKILVGGVGLAAVWYFFIRK